MRYFAKFLIILLFLSGSAFLFISNKSIILFSEDLNTNYFIVVDKHLPNSAVINEINNNKSVEEQLFQYAAGYSLAKKTKAQLFLLCDQPKNKLNTDISLSIKNPNIIKKTELVGIERLYFKWFQKNKAKYKRISNIVGKILGIKVIYVDSIVDESNFFVHANSEYTKNYFIKPDSNFNSEYFFAKYQNDIREQITLPKMSQELKEYAEKLREKNTVCISVDEANKNFSDKAVELTKKIIKDSEIVAIPNKTVDLEKLYLLSNCANNIISGRDISWWGAYLNVNDGITIAPYIQLDQYNSISNPELKYQKKALAQRAYPEDWIILNDQHQSIEEISMKYIKDTEFLAKVFKGYKPKEFDIYSGSGIELKICEGRHEFKQNLCYLDNREVNNKPTVVTMYYNLKKSKYNHNAYLQWSERFLSTPFNLVVFTNKENVMWIKELRKDLPIVIIEKNIEDLYHYKFAGQYEKIAKNDREHNQDNKKLHNKELYILWNEKVKLVNEVIKENPYKSDFFVWLDFGIFRDENYMSEKVFTSSLFMQQDKMTFFLNRDFSLENIKDNYYSDNPFTVSQGNIQLGNAIAWQIYNYLYDKTRDEFLYSNLPYGKDQSVMSTMFLRYPKLFNLIYYDPEDTSDKRSTYIWWYGLKYYSR